MPTLTPPLRGSRRRVSGKFGLTLFGLIFMGAGLLFTGLLFTMVQANYAARAWEETPCTILESRVDTVSDGYSVSLAFQYERQGNTYISRRLKPSGAGVETSVGKADALAAQYPAGAVATCFVNPHAPAEAVLLQGNPFFGLILLFPMVFVAIGGGVIYGAWARRAGNIAKTVSVSRQAARRGTGKVIQMLVFLVVLLAGLGVGYFLILPSILASMDAENWVETPCAILESRVQTHSDSDGDTYSVDILYAYTHKGRQFRSNRYEFIGGSSSGYEGKAAAVARYPAGAQAVCYVDPDHPESAVLKRELGAKAFLALIPVALVLVGIAGLVGGFRRKTNVAASANGIRRSGSGADALTRNAGQVTLNPRTSHAARVIGSFLVSIFWNGIVSVFVYEAYQGWRAGNPDLFLMLFLVPFVLIGLGFVAGIFYFLLAAFNPRPLLTLARHPVALGEKVRLNWATEGDVYKIQRFKLALTGEESARYRQGKNTTTDRRVFYEQTVVDSYRPEDMRRGEADVQIPPDAMHSFNGGNNAVTWKLSLHCEVPLWPDSREDFELTVLPAAPKGG